MHRAWGRGTRAVVVGAILGAALAGCTADDGGSDARDDAYDYPAVDLSADPAANIERLRVPADVLDAMSTEALVWSVLDFPYVGNALASSQSGGEVAFLAGQCDALAALLRRDDAADAVAAVRADYVDGADVDAGRFGELRTRLLDLVAAEVARG